MAREHAQVEHVARIEGLWPCAIAELGSGAQHKAYLLRHASATVVVRIRQGLRHGRERDAVVAEYEALGHFFAEADRVVPGFFPRHYRYAELEPGRFHTVSEYVEPGVSLETQPVCAIEAAGAMLAGCFDRLATTPVPRRCHQDGRLTWSASSGLGSDGRGGPLVKLGQAVQVLRPAWDALGRRFGVSAVNALSRNVTIAATTLRESGDERTFVNVDLNPAHFVFARDGGVRLLDPAVVIGPRAAALAQCAFATGWLWRAIYHAANPPLTARADALARLAGAYLRTLHARLSPEERVRVSAHIFVELLDRARGVLLHAAGRLPDADAQALFDPGLCFDRYSALVLQLLWDYRTCDEFPSSLAQHRSIGTPGLSPT